MGKLRRAGAILAVALLASPALSLPACGPEEPSREDGSAGTTAARAVSPDNDGRAPARRPSGDGHAGQDREPLGAHGYVVSVHRVVDGDTIEVRGPMEGIAEVRLIGVDTPETKDPRAGVQPYGEEAYEFTRFVLEGEKVALETDVEKRDRYGRFLAYAWLPGGEMFNEILLREGYAQVATFPPNTRYLDRFLSAQKEARSAGKGLWGLPDGQLCRLTDRGNGIGAGTPGCGEGHRPGAGKGVALYGIFTVL